MLVLTVKDGERVYLKMPGRHRSGGGGRFPGEGEAGD